MVVKKAALLRWLENRYLQRYLHGSGIEVGALSRRFSAWDGTTGSYKGRF
jgi:hypothetical protein